MSRSAILSLQRTIGNQAVQRMLKTGSGTQHIQRQAASIDNFTIGKEYIKYENGMLRINVQDFEPQFWGSKLHGDGVVKVTIDGGSDFEIFVNRNGSISINKKSGSFDVTDAEKSISFDYDESKIKF